MVNVETLCPNCMADMHADPVCAHCGTVPGSLARSPIAMPERTVLNDRFVIGRVLGRPGGFGVTYLAWDMVLETVAAIKEFLPLSSVSREAGTISVLPNSDEDAKTFEKGLRIFMKEAKTLAKFSHPNIVRVRDCFAANNTAYLVMDFHHGQSLNEFARSEGGKLSEALALQIMLPILDGLREVHSKQFLHRDIKPQNIYVTDRATPILLDFGAARMALAGATNTMTVMLSAGFAPFEQYHAKGRQGPWTDVYGCAATLYYLVSGKVPPDALERQHDDKLLPPLVFNPNLSKRFSDTIMRGLAIEPSARPQTAKAFHDALTDADPLEGATTVATEQVTTLHGAHPSRHPTPRPTTVIFEQYPATNDNGSRRWLWLALLVAAGALAWNRWQPHEPPAPPNNPPLAATSSQPQLAPATAVPQAAPTSPTQPEPAAPVQTAEVRPLVEPMRESLSPPSQPPAVPPRPVIDNPRPFSSRQAEAPPDSRRPRPPQLAFDACRSKPLHARCEIQGPRGRENGQCESFGGSALACVPDSHRDRAMMNPPLRSAKF